MQTRYTRIVIALFTVLMLISAVSFVFAEETQTDWHSDTSNLCDAGNILGYRIEVLNKEENYWVVRGTLENLNELQKLNYKLKIPAKEPRPREVEIKVNAYTDIQKVNELGVDIYSSQQNER